MASRQEPWTRLVHSKKSPGWVAYNPRTMRPQPLGDDTEHMKILSYNVNGLRNVVPSFSTLAQRENFDVLCLQETHLKASIVLSTSTPSAYSTPYHIFSRSWVASMHTWDQEIITSVFHCDDCVFVLFSGGRC